MDLRDEATRSALTARLAAPYAGRPMILGPGILAGYTPQVRWFRDLECPVLVVSTAAGAGDLPEPGECDVVEVAAESAVSLTDEVRRHDALARNLPEEARAAIDRFDPRHEGAWFTSPFVTTDEPIDRRPVVYGRPAAWVEIEDKMIVDEIWDAAGVDRPAYRIAAADDEQQLADATAELAGPLGVVWSGDARDGLNGGGNYIRWILHEHDQQEAVAFYREHCDRVRVQPFLEGVACSIHGFVLADGTAVFRPVEIVTLRDESGRRFQYAGLGAYWDPPDDDRARMREIARRVGGVLAERYGYRGAFGVDGVLTADGFRPTELNPRLSAGAALVTGVDSRFFGLLQAACVSDPDRVAELGITVDAIESLVPLMDDERAGRVIGFGEGVEIGGTNTYRLTWDGTRFERARDDADTGNVLSIADGPAGFFAEVKPCSAVRVGRLLAPVNLALARFLESQYDVDYGELTYGEDVREAAV